MADRIAVGLSRLGVGRNDVVALQLPNWWQFTLTYLACSRIGAVLNPLMHIFRERELSFMLKHGEAKVVIVPKVFRGFDHEQMVDGLAADSAATATRGRCRRRPAPIASMRCSRARPGKTSPTRSDILTRSRPAPTTSRSSSTPRAPPASPRACMHSANTLMANIIPYAERLNLGSNDVVLMASPMAHQTGFMYGLMMPIMLRASGRAAGHLGTEEGHRIDPDAKRELHDGLDAVPDRPGEDGRRNRHQRADAAYLPVRRRPDPRARSSSRRARCWARRSFRPGA